MRALTRVATPENEGDLLDLAKGSTTAQLERMVRGFRLGSRQEEVDREKERYESRSFSIFPDEEGMYVVKGRVTPEVGALLMRAVEAAGRTPSTVRGARKAFQLKRLRGMQPREEPTHWHWWPSGPWRGGRD